MTNNASFTRKVTYIAAIAVLLIPLSLLSRPSTLRKVGDRFEPNKGGVLATMRDDANLSQAKLGEIDPASEAMKLATLGLRGVAVNVLWDRANEYKKKHNWDNLSATLEQIARLQPNFVSVWEFQAHNMTYNVSIEFDDYRQRYNWVKKGIDYLFEGINYNHDEPRLLWFAGWVVGQKIGRSDERKQFRRIFRDDEDFHKLLKEHQIDTDSAKGADGKPDNWLCGRLWFLQAQQAVDGGKSLRGKTPAIFHSSPVMSRINFVSDYEREKDFDEDVVRNTWKTADEEWHEYGDRQLPSSGGFFMQLNSLESITRDFNDKFEELDMLVPGARQALRDEKISRLPRDLQDAIKKDPKERSDNEQVKASSAEQVIEPTAIEIADRASNEDLIEARNLAKQLCELSEAKRLIESSRRVVNFEFWKARCESGATETSTRARRFMFQGMDMLEKPDLVGAKTKYEQSFHEWGELHKQWPILKQDADTSDIIEAIEHYINVLDQLELRDPSGGILPPDFPLTDLVREKGRDELLRFRKEKAPEKTPQTPKTEPKSEDKSEDKSEAASDKPIPETKEADSKPTDEKKTTEEKSTEDKPADNKPEADKPQDKADATTENKASDATTPPATTP